MINVARGVELTGVSAETPEFFTNSWVFKVNKRKEIMSDSDQKSNKSDALVRLFEEGKQFTEDLLRENERLRRLAAAQKVDADMREKENIEEKGESDTVPLVKKLERERDKYKAELEELRKTLNEVEEENQEFAQKYVEVEQQNANLANLYVASYRLHSTLEFNEVVSIIKEIVINLVGSEKFGIFMKDEKSNDLQLISHEGLEDLKIPPITIGVGELGVVAEKGEVYFSDAPADGQKPIACIPLKIQEKPIAMIVIYQLLSQKDGFAQVDIEMFSLMADHAATAIYSSQLHTMSERKLSTMQGLLELLKQ